MQTRYMKRRVKNALSVGLATLAVFLGLFWLLWILVTLVIKGAPAINWSTLFEVTKPPGLNGGLYNAIVGSFLLLGWSILFAAPIGVLAGIYFAEYGRNSRLVGILRLINEILLSVPTIIIGLFIYQLYVVPTQHFSGWAGCIALAIIAIPVIITVTENMLLLVPNALREAATAMGAPHWKSIVSVILNTARTGVITGVLLSLARIAGETAPLLFTTLNNSFWNLDMNKPMGNLPSVIFQYALSPYDDWHQLAWTGAFLITMFVLFINISTRIITRQKQPILY